MNDTLWCVDQCLWLGLIVYLTSEVCHCRYWWTVWSRVLEDVFGDANVNLKFLLMDSKL
jgi:hypothetical protein